jgi:hypothetical protein
MRWSVRPKGAASLLAPVINWIGGQEQVIWASMKRCLETRQPPS